MTTLDEAIERVRRDLQELEQAQMDGVPVVATEEEREMVLKAAALWHASFPLREMIKGLCHALRKHDPLSGPCALCGYNGRGFYEAGTHQKRCPWFGVSGHSERLALLHSLKFEQLLLSALPDVPEVVK